MNMEQRFSRNMAGLKEVRQDISDSERKKADTKSTDKKGICLFFSFDIVNSTMYKSKESNWVIVIEALLNKIMDSVVIDYGGDLKTTIDAKLWRTIGDEIVFVTEIASKKDLYEYIRSVKDITDRITEELVNGVFLEDLQKKYKIVFMEDQLKNYLAIKSAAWISVVSGSSENALNFNDTIKFKYPTPKSEYDTPTEYLGKDMDMGFRLKEYTRQGRLIVSFDIAYILSQENSNSLYILGYEKLKGIWNEEIYPIIWYENKKIERIEESFKHNIIVRDKFIKKYLESIHNTNGISVQGLPLKPYYLDTKKALEKICADRNLSKRIERIENILENNSTSLNTSILPENSKLELHCAVVCVDTKENKVMIVHRKKNAEKQYWEFGCAKALNNEALVSTIKNYYKITYNIEIELYLDKKRTDKQPYPIAIYELDKGNYKAKGVILVARILNIGDFKETDKHDKRIFISKEEITMYSNEGAVNDFENTLERVFSNIEVYL